jgi:hypothetical protein
LIKLNRAARKRFGMLVDLAPAAIEDGVIDPATGSAIVERQGARWRDVAAEPASRPERSSVCTQRNRAGDDHPPSARTQVRRALRKTAIFSRASPETAWHRRCPDISRTSGLSRPSTRDRRRAGDRTGRRRSALAGQAHSVPAAGPGDFHGRWTDRQEAATREGPRSLSSCGVSDLPGRRRSLPDPGCRPLIAPRGSHVPDPGPHARAFLLVD